MPLDGLVIAPLDPDVFVPAPSQGALALEARRDDADTLLALRQLDDTGLRTALRAERALLAQLEGGCQLALGAWCRTIADGVYELVAALGTDEGLVRSRVRGSDPGVLARTAFVELTTQPRRALTGCRVLLTRAAEDNDVWGARLEELGASVVKLACIGTEVRVENGAALRAALKNAEWLALASRRAVAAVHELAGELPADLRIAAVGPGTARAAREQFSRCDLVSEEGTGASLGEALARIARGPVVVAAAEGGRREVEGLLGVAAQRVEVYGPSKEELVEPLFEVEVDAIVLASPSALKGLLARARAPLGARTIAIGPTTAAAARAAGLEHVHEADGRDFAAIVRALESLDGATPEKTNEQ